jgi:hypothetical protein
MAAQAPAAVTQQAVADAPAPQEASWDDVVPLDVLGLEVGYRLIPLVDKQEITLKTEPQSDWLLSPWMWQVTSSTEVLNDASAKMSHEASMKQMASEVAKEFNVDLGLLQSALETSQKALTAAQASAAMSTAQLQQVNDVADPMDETEDPVPKRARKPRKKLGVSQLTLDKYAKGKYKKPPPTPLRSQRGPMIRSHHPAEAMHSAEAVHPAGVVVEAVRPAEPVVEVAVEAVARRRAAQVVATPYGRILVVALVLPESRFR